MEHVAGWATAVAEAVETAVEEGSSVAKQLSRSSSSDSDQMYSPKEIRNFGGKAIAPSSETIILVPDVMNKSLVVDGNNSNGNSNSNKNNNSTTHSTVSILDIGEGSNAGYQKVSQDERELYLETLYKLPDFHKFYCPECKFCLTKVIILRDSPPSSFDSNVRDIVPGDIVPGPIGTGTGTGTGSIRCSNCFSFLAPIGDWISTLFGSPIQGADSPPSGTSEVPSRPSTGGRGPRDGDPAEPKGKSLEIIKSIVYGGLTEAITSLGIVTSAASANTPTENIVALALANLITGLIVITNNLSGLKSNQVKKEPNETNKPHVDPYEEALGDREHYVLHYTISILSFLIFGLLPPLVYGFSFRDTDDADLKLAAVAVTSLLCIALLAIAKAYVSKQHTWKEFSKTLGYYITLGFGASGLSYLAGKEFNILLEQLGWFKKDPMAPTLLLPNMNYAKPTWGSI